MYLSELEDDCKLKLIIEMHDGKRKLDHKKNSLIIIIIIIIIVVAGNRV